MSKDVAVSGKDINTKVEKSKGEKPKDEKPKVNIFKKVTRFFKDLKSEFKKIVWPTKKQVMNNTGIVITFMAVVAVALWCIDFVFIKLFSLIF